MSGKLVSWARARAKVDLPAPGEPMTSTSSISLAPSRNTHPQKTKRRPPCEDRRLFVSAKAASGGLLLGRRFLAVGGFGFVFGGLLGRGHVTGRSFSAFGLLERRRSNQRRDGEIAVGDRAFRTGRQRHFADVDRIADVLAGHADFALVGGLV